MSNKSDFEQPLVIPERTRARPIRPPRLSDRRRAVRRARMVTLLRREGWLVIAPGAVSPAAASSAPSAPNWPWPGRICPTCGRKDNRKSPPNAAITQDDIW
jgi:hypothetical protein